ncbi:hypothetical protein N7466_010515 [Penicillium verhagenii]|uniref:uncharacterized protein n=1 Tax=Penicillium verhagenii TaxID=1562060 RepID=UPI002545A2E0|nr:uncharacterized protein N7466_010515 [Penicillium verhagenii]KAJ5918523.1 hypothetical protein N7466_010515 [Penicillium verhagenii]
MGEPMEVRAAFKEANDFLSPVLNRGIAKVEIENSEGKSLLETLNQTEDLAPGGGERTRTSVITKALQILSRIHNAFVTPDLEQSQFLATEGEDGALEDAKRRRMLHALLDLISLEGIYPSLSSGVGIPLQQRVISVLPAGVIATQAPIPTSSSPRNVSLLRKVMETLLTIIMDTRSSMQPIIRGRILSDLISGTADLAFNPNCSDSEERNYFQTQFTRILDETPSVVLLPTLSAFLQTDPTAWFKSIVSSQISQIPLRSGGVLQTIMFIASQCAPSLGQEAHSEPSNGPHLTLPAIMHISKLLSSVPQGADPVSYFKIIAPQLLTILDGEDPDLVKTVSYTIGSGILGKRSSGAPGTIGHAIFVEPLFNTLTAELNDSTRRWMLQSEPLESKRSILSNIIVDDTLVDRALDRLQKIALQHPNPGLVKRIVSPILLPLWGLLCYSKEHELEAIHARIMAILQTYFSISVGLLPLKKLVDNLLWDGGSTWTYNSSVQGGVDLVKRNDRDNDQSNLIKLIDSLQNRTELFAGLLGSDPRSEDLTGDIFLYASQTWLVSSKTQGPQTIGDSENMFKKLISAKVAEKLLDTFKDTLSRRPLRVLELIKQVIDGELHTSGSNTTSQGGQKSGTPSLSTLANIVSPESTNDEELNNDASESLSTAFSLLSTVLASAEFSMSEDIKSLLGSIKASLDELIPFLPNSLSKPATTSSMLLEITLTSPEYSATKAPLPHIADLETHRQALANLNSDLPPVQGEGFSLLSKLILKSSPVLDIPSTLTLLLSIITDVSESTANEDFIYLNAIKLIGTLASRHPHTVVKTLVDSYADKNEQRTLDQRLKLGESLLRTVQDLGTALTGETAKTLGETMVSVAGRRGSKPQAQKSRKRQEEKERRAKEREERKQKDLAMPEGWKSSVGPSSLKELDPDSDDDESPEQSAHAANIVAAWAAGAPSDSEPEDLRIRASAVSILASAIQTNIIGLGSTIVASAVDLALATLTLEPAPESAILRRASVVLILDIVKALDTAREERKGRDVGFGFSIMDDGYSHAAAQSRGPATIGNIPSMLRTLGFSESREEDVIVRGHLRVLIESLEAWLEKSLMWGIGSGGVSDIKMELDDHIAGLDVDPLAGRGGSSRPRIEEIE